MKKRINSKKNSFWLLVLMMNVTIILGGGILNTGMIQNQGAINNEPLFPIKVKDLQVENQKLLFALEDKIYIFDVTKETKPTQISTIIVNHFIDKVLMEENWLVVFYHEVIWTNGIEIGNHYNIRIYEIHTEEQPVLKTTIPIDNINRNDVDICVHQKLNYFSIYYLWHHTTCIYEVKIDMRDYSHQRHFHGPADFATEINKFENIEQVENELYIGFTTIENDTLGLGVFEAQENGWMKKLVVQSNECFEKEELKRSEMRITRNKMFFSVYSFEEQKYEKMTAYDFTGEENLTKRVEITEVQAKDNILIAEEKLYTFKEGEMEIYNIDTLENVQKLVRYENQEKTYPLYTMDKKGNYLFVNQGSFYTDEIILVLDVDDFTTVTSITSFGVSVIRIGLGVEEFYLLLIGILLGGPLVVFGTIAITKVVKIKKNEKKG